MPSRRIAAVILEALPEELGALCLTVRWSASLKHELNLVFVS